MVPRLGLEPRIYSLEGCCLIHSAIGAKNLHSCYACHRTYNYKQSPSDHYFDINIIAHPTPDKGDKSTYTA